MADLCGEQSSQNRLLSEDLRLLKTRIHNYEQEEETSQRNLAQLRKRAELAEAAVTRAHEQQQQHQHRREPEDRSSRGALSDATLSHVEPSTRAPGRPYSPLHSPLRTWSSELLVPQLMSKTSRAGSVASASLDGLGRLSSPREPSSHAISRVLGASDLNSPPVSGKQYSSYDASIYSMSGPLSTQGHDRDDVSDDNADAFSTMHRAVPDTASVSTTAAGPSIQLVERMSAGIRRLEAEKVAGREELLRISNQRDEARAEMVTLMKEVESGRQASDRVAVLEKEVSEINERYQTTLELLGEKSELVEELRADVDDVKAMYRELVERTIR